MRPNAFGGVWTSLDGFGRFCFFPHKPGVGKFLFKDSLCFCAVSLPTCSVFAWGWKFLTSTTQRRSRLTLLDKAKPFSDAFGSSESFPIAFGKQQSVFCFWLEREAALASRCFIFLSTCRKPRCRVWGRKPAQGRASTFRLGFRVLREALF